MLRPRYDWRGLAAGIAAAAGFLIFHRVLILPDPMPWGREAIAFGLALGVYLGTFLVLPKPRGLFDVLSERASAVGVSADEFTAAVAQARERIADIREIAQALDPAEAARTEEACGLAEAIVDGLEDNPEDFKRSRRFLEKYLPDFAEIVRRYRSLREKRRHASVSTDEVLAKYNHLLDDMMDFFRRQYDRNLSDDTLDLDVDIDVIRRDMTMEGV